jgi:hypothetical protein
LAAFRLVASELNGHCLIPGHQEFSAFWSKIGLDWRFHNDKWPAARSVLGILLVLLAFGMG